MPLISVSDLPGVPAGYTPGGHPDLPPAPKHVNLDPPKPVVGPQTYKQYVERLQAVCLTKNLPLDYVGTVWSGPYHRTSHPIYRVTIRRPSPNQSPLGVVATLHGDERAAALGVLDFLENVYPAESRGAVCPLYPVANPWGFDKQRRENGWGLDVNRTFGPGEPSSEEAKVIAADLAKFPISFLHTMHEDGTRTGFYAYYTDSGRRWLADRLVECATAHKLPINSSGTDYGGVVRIERGLAPYNRGLYPTPAGGTPLEDLYLDRNVPHFCTETPMQADIWSRIKCNSELLKLVWTFV